MAEAVRGIKINVQAVAQAVQGNPNVPQTPSEWQGGPVRGAHAAPITRKITPYRAAQGAAIEQIREKMKAVQAGQATTEQFMEQSNQWMVDAHEKLKDLQRQIQSGRVGPFGRPTPGAATKGSADFTHTISEMWGGGESVGQAVRKPKFPSTQPLFISALTKKKKAVGQTVSLLNPKRVIDVVEQGTGQHFAGLGLAGTPPIRETLREIYRNPHVAYFLQKTLPREHTVRGIGYGIAGFVSKLTKNIDKVIGGEILAKKVFKGTGTEFSKWKGLAQEGNAAWTALQMKRGWVMQGGQMTRWPSKEVPWAVGQGIRLEGKAALLIQKLNKIPIARGVLRIPKRVALYGAQTVSDLTGGFISPSIALRVGGPALVVAAGFKIAQRWFDTKTAVNQLRSETMFSPEQQAAMQQGNKYQAAMLGQVNTEINKKSNETAAGNQSYFMRMMNWINMSSSTAQEANALAKVQQASWSHATQMTQTLGAARKMFESGALDNQQIAKTMAAREMLEGSINWTSPNSILSILGSRTKNILWRVTGQQNTEAQIELAQGQDVDRFNALVAKYTAEMQEKGLAAKIKAIKDNETAAKGFMSDLGRSFAQQATIRTRDWLNHQRWPKLGPILGEFWAGGLETI